MTFSIDPIFPGDIYESALRLGSAIATKDALQGDHRIASREQAWATAVGLGWPSLMVPEDDGGAGGALCDLAAIAEGCGQAGLSMPWAAFCHDAPVLLGLAAAASSSARSLLRGVASGEALVAWASATPSSPQAQPVIARREGPGYVLRGKLFAVEALARGTHYLLAFTDGQAPFRQGAMLCLPACADGLTTQAYLRLDGRPVVDLCLNGVALEHDALLWEGPGLGQALERLENAGILLAAAENVGAMGQLIASTIDYLCTRKQFGSALSSFQVLRHDLTDMYVSYENLRALTQFAFQQSGDGPPDLRLASLLKLALGRSGRQLAEAAIQLHGGMGMTEELLAARLGKRLLMAEFEHGGTPRHLERAASLVFHERAQA